MSFWDELRAAAETDSQGFRSGLRRAAELARERAKDPLADRGGRTWEDNAEAAATALEDLAARLDKLAEEP